MEHLKTYLAITFILFVSITIAYLSDWLKGAEKTDSLPVPLKLTAFWITALISAFVSYGLYLSIKYLIS